MVEIPLRGAGGEPVDLARTLRSHGVADLLPNVIDDIAISLTTTLEMGSGKARTIVIAPGGPHSASISVLGRRPSSREASEIEARVRFILRLDQDLSDFYSLVKDDPQLAWAASGAGRMTRSASAFEDVIKTICTTNCTWSATERMVAALVSELGTEDDGGRKAFPGPAAMASADEAFYKEVVRAGYRGPYLRSIAEMVAGDHLDIEEIARCGPGELSDDDLEALLLTLPGVGPYAAAHIGMMFGRYSRLILDSWTRPTFLQRSGMKQARDSTIVRRFKRYGPYAGLAFWLYLTRDWVAEDGV